MSRQFVTEAVMVAIYGQLLAPQAPVEYIVPYTTILELYEFQTSPDPLMDNPADDQHVKSKINEIISYFEEPLNKKKIERALAVPWAKSPSILFGDQVSIAIINAIDTAQYGEYFDPIETELLLTSQRLDTPILTDQVELIARIIESASPVQVFDIDDFDFAMDDEEPLDQV
ncbi:ADP-heptose synthase [Chryseobacterium mucoviscidosis]|uniref:ADP-heptose synthase n=1 Tax=unclassified Paenibacillus TaxID=185978 RepID=UPI0009A25E47|nr:ADP-heptose synthase [Paenibacillus sp. 11B]MDN8589575.1 ADP-heptose synthase [Paenibacillus sp. 11B]OPG97986.1 ADP-heptose synthase [Chryseobacterium mucoviscidosis]